MKKPRAKKAESGGGSRSAPASPWSKRSAAPRPESTPPALPPEWHEFLSLLSSHRVRFLVVGAHALAALGRPRATGDLDIFVEPTPTNAARIADVFAAFGMPALAAVAAAQLAVPDRMTRLGNEPLRIDVMSSISGVSFAEAWASRVRGRLGPLQVGFLGRDAFVRNKKASGRTKDLLDIALLAETGRAPKPRRGTKRTKM